MKEQSSIFKSLTRSIPDDIRKEVDLSFAIADRVERLLAEKGMTQKDLAMRLGKKESEISKWLRGTHNFTTRTISKLSAALGEDIVVVQGAKNVRQDVFVFIPLSQSSAISVGKNGSYDKFGCNLSHSDPQIHYYEIGGIN